MWMTIICFPKRKRSKRLVIRMVLITVRTEECTYPACGSCSDLVVHYVICSCCMDEQINRSQRSGYLEKRGKRNTAWKERWFVLQDSKLYYYKTEKQAKSINFIPLHDSQIRETRHHKPYEYTFEITTTHRYCSFSQVMCCTFALVLNPSDLVLH